MRSLKSAALVVAAMFGAVTSAWAGAGTLAVTVTPLSPNVTYSRAAPLLDTFVGLKVQLTNAGGNTINDISFTFKATATDQAEVVALFNAELYLPAGCTKTSTSEFACTVGQLKSGKSFPPVDPLVVFYKAPTKVVGCSVDGVGCDYVSTNMHVLYAEGLNGPPVNSVADLPSANLVLLGTTNSIDIKSAVPKSGAKLYTGSEGGTPTPNNRLTELVEIPTLSGTSLFTTAVIDVAKVPDSSTADPQCGNLGHFRDCPIYTTTIPGAFAAAPWLKTTYRIDASNLKMSPAKILNSVQISYTGGIFTKEPVYACPSSAPLGTGLPCILSSFCYKRSTPGWTLDLDGDCEWILINTENGRLAID